jgi:hypothetical protein
MEFTISDPDLFRRPADHLEGHDALPLQVGELKLGIKILRIEREQAGVPSWHRGGDRARTGVEAILGNPA